MSVRNIKCLIRRPILLTALLLVLLALSMIAGLRFGSADFGFDRLIGGLLCRDGFETERLILWSIRVPRVAAGAISGIGLAISGVLLQAVTGNALASPNIIGVNAGAGFCVIVCLAFFPQALFFLPLAAFSGAFLTTLLILALSRKIGTTKLTVVLAGIACNAILNAGISFLSILDPDAFSSYHFFSVGGFSGITAEQLYLPCSIILLCLAAVLVSGPRISLLCLGDGMATSLGVKVSSLRMFCLVVASLSAACVVSFAGLIGFVGLIVPHIARRLVGIGVRQVTAVSALLGAILVILSDTAGRTLAAPTEIPVGILLSFIGGPFFLMLLFRKGGNADA